MKRALSMSDDEIRSELDALGKQWDEFRKDCEMAGSPGEWMYERMDELENELERRAAT